MNYMPEKNPDVWVALWGWIVSVWQNNHHQVCGFVSGMVVAYFRALYYGKEGSKTKRFAESIICGTIAATAQPVLSKLGVGSDFLPFVGTALGLLGLDFILNNTQRFADRWIKRKSGDEDKNGNQDGD